MYVLSFYLNNGEAYICEASFLSEDKEKLKILSDTWNKAFLDCFSYEELPKEIKFGELTFVKGKSKDKYACGDIKISASATLHISKAHSFF
jgi:hypothetical protein